MKFCGQCGAGRRPVAKFCRQCGSPFASNPVALKPSSVDLQIDNAPVIVPMIDSGRVSPEPHNLVGAPELANYSLRIDGELVTSFARTLDGIPRELESTSALNPTEEESAHHQVATLSEARSFSQTSIPSKTSSQATEKRIVAFWVVAGCCFVLFLFAAGSGLWEKSQLDSGSISHSTGPSAPTATERAYQPPSPPVYWESPPALSQIRQVANQWVALYTRPGDGAQCYVVWDQTGNLDSFQAAAGLISAGEIMSGKQVEPPLFMKLDEVPPTAEVARDFSAVQLFFSGMDIAPLQQG
jgi:hypothetical protein